MFSHFIVRESKQMKQCHHCLAQYEAWYLAIHQKRCPQAPKPLEPATANTFDVASSLTSTMQMAPSETIQQSPIEPFTCGPLDHNIKDMTSGSAEALTGDPFTTINLAPTVVEAHGDSLLVDLNNEKRSRLADLKAQVEAL